MGGFVKVYDSILESSVWGESLSVRVVWITVLAMSDRNGLVAASSDGISRRANVPMKATEHALSVLESPDMRSKSPEHDGRRIERVSGGYQILNYSKYRELRTDSQIATAERQRRFRESHRDAALHNGDVTPSNAPSRTKAEAEAEAETPTTGESGYPPDFELLWNHRPRRSRPDNKQSAFKAYKARLRDGCSYDAMFEGMKRYRAYLHATGKEGTEYVKLTSTFLGPDRHFADEWIIPPPPQPQVVAEARKVSGVIPISRGPIQW